MLSLSTSIAALEDIFQLFNTKYYNNELQQPIISVSPDTCKGSYGWFTMYKAWQLKDNKEDEGYYEINICAEYLNRPAQAIIGTLVHEMVHLYCLQNEIKGTCKNGKYHNTKYRNCALQHGLLVEKNEKLGWSITRLNEESEALIKDIDTNVFNVYRVKIEKQVKKTKSSLKYFCPDCLMHIRSTKEVDIICADCKAMMICNTINNI